MTAETNLGYTIETKKYEIETGETASEGNEGENEAQKAEETSNENSKMSNESSYDVSIYDAGNSSVAQSYLLNNGISISSSKAKKQYNRSDSSRSAIIEDYSQVEINEGVTNSASYEGIQLDIDKYYDEFHKKYSSAKDKGYIAAVKSALLKDLSTVFGIDSANTDSMKALCIALGTVNQIKCSSIDEFANAIAIKSWNGKLNDDLINLNIYSSNYDETNKTVKTGTSKIQFNSTPSIEYDKANQISKISGTALIDGKEYDVEENIITLDEKDINGNNVIQTKISYSGNQSEQKVEIYLSSGVHITGELQNGQMVYSILGTEDTFESEEDAIKAGKKLIEDHEIIDGNALTNSIENEDDTSINATSTQSTENIANSDIKSLYSAMGLDSLGLNYSVFELAIQGYNNLKDKGNGYLGIFDVTQSSSNKRYYLIDMKNHKLITRSIMKEGSNQSATIAGANKNGSHSTVSGFVKVGGDTSFYRSSTGDTCAKYVYGLESGINDNANSKGILVHPTQYDTSWGCYAFPFIYKSNGSIDWSATKKRMDELAPKGTIIFTYPKNSVSEYKKLSSLV